MAKRVINNIMLFPAAIAKSPPGCTAPLLRILTLLALVLFAGCGKGKQAEPADHPRLTPGVKMLDVTFHSAALGRDMTYRAILPAEMDRPRKFPVLYLLHGGGGGFRDWSNYSDVARYAEQGLILVMPEGESSYYVNSADHPQDRFEDYIIHDLIPDVEQRFPAAAGRDNRSIAGVSMGGFGAVLLALKHPDLFTFAGGLSPAVDVPSRPFSVKRIGQWRHHRSIFGPQGGKHQQENDPFAVARSADPAQTYFFLTCGEQEGLLPANRKFAALLAQHHFHYEFHQVPGGHDWNQWNRNLPSLMKALFLRLPTQM